MHSFNQTGLSNNEIKSEPLEKDDIAKFFQIVTNLAEANLGSISDITKQLRKSYLNYVKAVLNEDTNAFSRAKTIKTQITILINYNVFKDELENSKLESIKFDLENNGRLLLSVVTEEYRAEFIEDLENTNVTKENKRPSTVPINIKAGHSFTEIKSSTSPIYQTLTKAKQLITECKELDKQKKHAELIEKMSTVISSLTAIYDQLEPEHKLFLIHYSKELAKGYYAIGIKYCEEKRFEIGIENIKKALTITQELTKKYGEENQDELETYHTKLQLETYTYELAHNLGYYGVEARNQKNFPLSIKCFNDAIDVLKSQPSPLHEEDIKNIALMKHLIGITQFYCGYNYHSSKNGDELKAIQHVIKAISTLKAIEEERPTATANIHDYRISLALIRETHADNLMGNAENRCRELKESKEGNVNEKYLNALTACKTAIDFLMPIKQKLRGNAEWRISICQLLLKTTADKFRKSHPNAKLDLPDLSVYKEAIKIITYLRKTLALDVLSNKLEKFIPPNELLFFKHANHANQNAQSVEIKKAPVSNRSF